MINHQNFGNPNQSMQAPPGYMLVPDPRMQGDRRSLGDMMGMSGNMQMNQSNQQAFIPQIPARMVSSIEEIRPNEVPQDGSIALFMRNDYKEIYAKARNNQNGLIDNVTYVPLIQQPDPKIEDKSQNWETVFERLDRIENKVDRMTYRKPYYKNNKQNHNKEDNHEQSEQ